jgi:hypothetical protein
VADMQTVEAMLSLAVFLSILLCAVPALEDAQGPDDSLYRMQLAQDAWRVLYLRGDFEDFGEGRRGAIEKDLDVLGRETSLCIFLNGTRFTNCRGGRISHTISVSLSRTLILDGQPAVVRFSLGN